MARKKLKQVRKARQAKSIAEAQCKINYAGSQFTEQHGLVILGQGVDGRMYGWNTLAPAGWSLMESVPMTQEQSIALQLGAQQSAQAQPRPKRSLKVANGATTDEAFE